MIAAFALSACGSSLHPAGSHGRGRLDVAAVLSSLYPVVTIVLAAAVLRERIGRVQAAGILAAAGAIVLIAAG